MDIRISQVLSTIDVLEPHVGGALLGPGDIVSVGHRLGAGGFGLVHECDAVDGVSQPGVVIKRYEYNGVVAPEDCAAVLTTLHAALRVRWGSCPDAPRRLLPGIPYWVGRASWGGEDVVVSLARDLNMEGYIAFESVVEDPSALRAWLKLPLKDRLAAAQVAASSYSLVEELSFVHGDINIENTFVDPAGLRSALIDWDSGTLPGAPNDRPLAWGKPDDFIAPEVKAGAVLDPSRINMLSDRWAIGLLIHYLLFGVGPLFFLKILSDKKIAEYLDNFTWPDIDRGSDLFNDLNRGFYVRYLQDLADLPPAAVELFRRFVTEGSSRPSERPAAHEWRDSLAAIVGPPEFAWVDLDRDIVIQGEPVVVSWSAPDAQEVFVNGAGPFGANDFIEVVLDRCDSIRLEASSAFGSNAHESERVIVIRVPRAPDLSVPVPQKVDIGPARDFRRLLQALLDKP